MSHDIASFLLVLNHLKCPVHVLAPLAQKPEREGGGREEGLGGMREEERRGGREGEREGMRE